MGHRLTQGEDSAERRRPPPERRSEKGDMGLPALFKFARLPVSEQIGSEGWTQPRRPVAQVVSE